MKKPGIIRVFWLALAAVILSSALISGCGGGDGGSTDPNPTPTGVGAQWTFMVYICGDNDLERYGYLDMKELEKVGSDANVNIVVQWDRSGIYDDSVDWTGARRYYVTKDSEGSTEIVSTLISELGDTNMGAPETLTEFVRWGVANYPANRYAVVLWNHGGGWRKKADKDFVSKYICYDETFNDELSTTEVRQSLTDIYSYVGRKLDLLGMDACLMANAEVAYEVRNYARYLSFSEESEDANGWPYDTILADLVSNPTMDGSVLARTVVTHFGQYYSSSNTATQSAVDLSKMDNLISAIDAFSDDAIGKMTTEQANLQNAGTQARGMDGTSEYKDLGDYFYYVGQNVSDTQLKSEAQAVITALDSAVISYFAPSGESGYSGMTIWVPTQNGYNTYQSQYDQLLFTQGCSWSSYLNALLN